MNTQIKEKELYENDLKKNQQMVLRKLKFIGNQIKKIQEEPQPVNGLPKGLNS